MTAFQSYVFNIGLGLGTASSHVAKIFEALGGASGRVFYLLDCIASPLYFLFPTAAAVYVATIKMIMVVMMMVLQKLHHAVE